MKNNNSLIVKKENIFLKIINKIKRIFIIKEEKNINKTIQQDNTKEVFLGNIKINIDTEITKLKLELENGNIKAIDLTDEQINKLQKIYDEEIERKKKILKKFN